MLEIQRALTACGARVRLATHGGPHERVFADAGVELDRLGEPMSDARAREFARSIPGIAGPRSNMWTVDELRAFVAAELAYFAAHDVCVAVTGWTNSAMISTRVAGIPLVTEHAGSMLPPLWENNLLPVPSVPPTPLLRILPHALAVRAMNFQFPRERGFTTNFNIVAREHGVEELPGLAAMLLGDLSLVTDVPEMFGFSRQAIDEWRPRDPRRYRRGVRLRYSGPLFARLATPIPDRVDAFLERRPVYVAITSSEEALVRAVVRQLAQLNRPLLVASTVHDLSDMETDEVMIEPVLPSHQVMARAALVVGAGGQGTLQSAMANGVPLLAMPLQPEQDTNIALAERRGAARLVSLKDAATPRVATLAAEMLADPSYRNAAQRMRTAYARVDGAREAAAAILDVAHNGIDARETPARRP